MTYILKSVEIVQSGQKKFIRSVTEDTKTFSVVQNRDQLLKDKAIFEEKLAVVNELLARLETAVTKEVA